MKEIKVLYTLTMRPVNKASKLHSQPLCTWRVLLTANRCKNAYYGDGQLTGAISGGCLEGDALNKALFVMAQQKAMLVTYDTMEDDDAGLALASAVTELYRC